MPVGIEENGRKHWMSLYVSFNEGDFLDTYDKLTAVRVGFYYQSSIDTYLVMKALDGSLIDTVSVPATEEGCAGYLWFDLTKYLKDSIEAGQKFSKRVTIEYPEYPDSEAGMVWLIADNEFYDCDYLEYHQYYEKPCAECYANDYAYYPTLEVQYNEDDGLAGQYAYSQTSVGTSGTLFVNYYTGKPSFVYSDGNLYGNIMPVSLYHTFEQGKWRFSLDQTYSHGVYYDSFGAKIKLSQYSNSTIDSSGLGLTLKSRDGNMVIVDKQQNELIFIKPSYYAAYELTQIKDRNGNTVTIGENTITGASGEVYSLEYANSLMTKLTYPDGQAIVYTYDTQKRITSVANRGNTTTFTYDSEGRLVAVTDGLSQTKIVINYDAKDRVTQITEQTSSGATVGQSIKFSYNFSYKTTYTTSGKDDIIDTADDTTVSVQFDRWGRTTGTYYEADSKLLSTATQYNSADENSTYAEMRKNNKQTISTIFSNAAANYLPNNSIENDAHWFSFTAGTGGTGTGAFPPLSTTTSKYGDRSIKLDSSTESGYLTSAVQRLTLPAGTYTLSAYVKTENIAGDGGAFIGISNSLNSSNINTIFSWSQISDYIKGTTAEFANDGWRRITHTFTLSNSATIYVGGGIKNASGTAYFDCFQLEKGSLASQYNLVENGGFEYNDLTFNISYEERTWLNFMGSITQENGDNCLSVDPSEYAYPLVALQDIPVKKSGISSLYVSCFTKINSIPTLLLSNQENTLSVSVQYTDGTTVEEEVDANSLDTEWQYLSFMVLTDPEKTIDSIEIYFWYLSYEYPAYVDDVSIIVSDGTKLEYDDEGNIVSSDPAETDETTMEYDALNRLTELTDTLGKTYTYTYDDNGNMTHAESSIGTYVDAAYDNRGLATSTITSGRTTTENGIIGTDKKLYSSAEYTQNGGYTSSVTDSTGLVANYDYNTLNGLLQSASTSDNPNAVTRYSYTALKQLSKVFIDQNNDGIRNSSESVVNYQYNNKSQLQSITANGLTYNFSYDAFGNMTSVGISGRTPLATYNYGTNNGKLKSVTYADGTTLTYEYDNLERLVKVKNGNYTVKEYTYDLYGNVTELTDADWTQQYIYDDFNRPLESYSDGIGELRAQYGYDAHSRLSKVLYEYSHISAESGDLIATLSSLYEYEYGENEAVKRVKHNSQTLLEYTFDSLGRRINTVYSKLIQNNSPYTATFSYKDSTVGANATTPLVNAITYPDHSYGYTYKTNGDIEAVTYTYGTSTYTSYYHYDDLRRLVREDNGYINKTYTYEYDASGNILNRKEYSYTIPTAQVGTATSTDAYTYGDSTWKDLLTSYNGESIVYDALGNPTTYRGNTMEWDNATRKLMSMLTDEQDIFFHYDASGARKIKNLYDGTDTTNVHFYHYDGGTLLYEAIATIVSTEENTTFSEELIQYVIDETGSHIGFIHNGTEYYFAKNLQGDVQRIYTANGTLVGEYHYDAWGNILNESSLTEIAQLNPIRYRSYYYDSETGLYYLNSRYYDPETGRFINADGYVSTGQDILGYNMFAYCGNNPVMRIDPTGCRFLDVSDFVLPVFPFLSLPSLEYAPPTVRMIAAEKYNKDTVNVYKEGIGIPQEGKLNVRVYDVNEEGTKVNISIEDSLSIEARYEMDAVLDVIMESEYYSYDMFGSKDFMRAQWVAHNAGYKIASSSDVGFWVMQIVSGSDDPTQSSSSLDIRSKNNILKRQKAIYDIISWAY